MTPSPRYLATWPPNRVIASAPARWYPSTVSRHCSGSSRAAIPVEPTRSQNSTVRWRRAPATSADSVGDDSEIGMLTSAVRAAPHLPQKFDVGAFSAPHFRQRRASAFPQRAQKLFPAGFSASHLVQRIRCPPPLRQSEDRAYSRSYASHRLYESDGEVL